MQISFLNVWDVSCTTITKTNVSCYNASVFGSLFVDNIFFSFANSCSYLLGVGSAEINYLNMSTLTMYKFWT